MILRLAVQNKLVGVSYLGNNPVLFDLENPSNQYVKSVEWDNLVRIALPSQMAKLNEDWVEWETKWRNTMTLTEAIQRRIIAIGPDNKFIELSGAIDLDSYPTWTSVQNSYSGKELSDLKLAWSQHPLNNKEVNKAKYKIIASGHITQLDSSQDEDYVDALIEMTHPLTKLNGEIAVYKLCRESDKPFIGQKVTYTLELM